jgi:AcrR family transcriptional regulator
MDENGQTRMVPETLLSSPTDSRRARIRQRILDAAGQRFAAEGYAKARVEEIARHAGVSKGLVYVHFRNKEELLQRVLEQTLNGWREATREAMERVDGVCEAIAVMHRASIEYARRNPVLRTILMRDAGLLLALDDEAPRRSMEVWRQRLIALLERGVESGELRADLDVERSADVIRLLHRAFLDRLYGDGVIQVTDPRLIEASVDVLLHGLAHHRPRRRRARR